MIPQQTVSISPQRGVRRALVEECLDRRDCKGSFNNRFRTTRHRHLSPRRQPKLVQIAKGIRCAIESGNPTVRMSLVRSLLEHTAALSFQVQKLSGIQDDLSRQADVEQLKNALARHQTVLNRIYFNQLPFVPDRRRNISM